MGEAARVQKYEQLGHDHMRAADRSLKQKTLPNSPKLKFYDSINLWHKAGKCFQIAGEWEESANAFGRAATYMRRVGQGHEAAVYWLKSADMMRRMDPLGSVWRYENAIDAYVELGRGFTSGNIATTIAEIFEGEKQFGRAIGQYKRASDLYAAEHFTVQSSQCLFKAAMVSALVNDFEVACLAFQTVAETSSRHNLLRLNLPDTLLRAGLCLLADGGSLRGGLYTHQLLRFYMRKWAILDYAWEYSRERQFLDNLLTIIPKCDVDAFADHVYSFDNVVGLEAWHLRMLNRVKEDLDEEVARKDALNKDHEAARKQAMVDRQAKYKVGYTKKVEK